MTSLTARSCRLFILASCLLIVAPTGCVWLPTDSRAELTMEQRPSLALLPVGFDIESAKLSALASTDEALSTEEDVRHVAETLQEIRANARWLLLSRLATGHQLRFVSFEETDALMVPGLVLCAVRLIPAALIEECRLTIVISQA